MAKTSNKQYQEIVKKSLEGFNGTFGTNLKLYNQGGNSWQLLDEKGNIFRPFQISNTITIKEMFEAIQWMYKAVEALKLNKNMKTFEHELGIREIPSTHVLKVHENILYPEKFVIQTVSLTHYDYGNFISVIVSWQIPETDRSAVISIHEISEKNSTQSIIDMAIRKWINRS